MQLGLVFALMRQAIEHYNRAASDLREHLLGETGPERLLGQIHGARARICCRSGREPRCAASF